MIVLACFLVTACGFQPLYGDQSVASAEFAQISISNIPDRSGQYLRNALIDRFYSDGWPINSRYVLRVHPIKENTVNLDITKNSDATRAQLRLGTTMILMDQATKETLLTRNLSAISSYNVLTSEFATSVSAQKTRENALDDLARQIELQIGLYFRR